MTHIRVLLAGLVITSLCMANISGIVTDTGTTPIVDVVVQLESGGPTAMTGADGLFTLVTGNTANLPGKSKAISNDLAVRIFDNWLTVTISVPSVVEIKAFDLNGKLISTVCKAFDAGSNRITYPQRGTGIYVYQVKAGNYKLVLKGNTAGGVSIERSSTAGQLSSSPSLTKQAKTMGAINDVISATKSGYLNYRISIKNSDTSGVTIKMISSAGTVTDTDGNVYKTVRIGTQVWMVENLKITKYNDGTTIPLVTDNAAWVALTTPGYCFYRNDADTNKAIYGALYNWYAVNTGNLAPTGWHVPTDAEWTILATFLGGEDVAGGKLKEAAMLHWYTPNYSATNETGFSALPGGYRHDDGTFSSIGYHGFWWSATQAASDLAYYCDLYYYNSSLGRNRANFVDCGFSVRLVRD